MKSPLALLLALIAVPLHAETARPAEGIVSAPPVIKSTTMPVVVPTKSLKAPEPADLAEGMPVPFAIKYLKLIKEDAQLSAADVKAPGKLSELYAMMTPTMAQVRMAQAAKSTVPRLMYFMNFSPTRIEDPFHIRIWAVEGNIVILQLRILPKEDKRPSHVYLGLKWIEGDWKICHKSEVTKEWQHVVYY